MTDSPTFRVNGSLRSGDMGYNTGQPEWSRHGRPVRNWNGHPVIFGVDIRDALMGVGDHAAALRYYNSRDVECSVTLDDDGVTVEAPATPEQTETIEITPPPGVEVGGNITYALVDGELVRGVVTDIVGDRATLRVLSRSTTHNPATAAADAEEMLDLSDPPMSVEEMVVDMGRRAGVEVARMPVTDTMEHTPISDAVAVLARPVMLGAITMTALVAGTVESILTDGRWAFSGGSYLVTGVMGTVTYDGEEGETRTMRRSFLPHEYMIERTPEHDTIVVHDLNLARWGNHVPDIYVHLIDGRTEPVSVPMPYAAPLSTRVYGPTTRVLDLRTDEERYRDVLQWKEDNRMCRLYPSCECAEHGRVKECFGQFGALFDDG